MFSWNIDIKALEAITAIGLAQGRAFGQAELAGAGLTIATLCSAEQPLFEFERGLILYSYV